MSTRDGFHIRTVVPGACYALDERVCHPGRTGRTRDEIDDDIDGPWQEWREVATFATFEAALAERHRRADAQWDHEPDPEALLLRGFGRDPKRSDPAAWIEAGFLTGPPPKWATGDENE